MQATLPPAMQRALKGEVGAERLLWHAQPDPRRQVMAFAIYIFAIPWTAFALFWDVMALTPWLVPSTPTWVAWTFGILFPLFGLPFIAVGCWMLWLPFQRIRQARQTVFALTEQRLLSIRIGKALIVKTIWIDRIGPMERQTQADGSGDLSIQTHSRIDSDGDRLTERFEIVGVPRIGELERLIIGLQAR